MLGLEGIRRPGFGVLGLVASSVGLHIWLVRSVFLALDREPGVEHVFVSAGFGTFAAAMLVAWLSVLGVHAVVRWGEARDAARTALFARDDTAYLRPLCCFAASTLVLGSLVPGLSTVMPAWSFLILDLRWWWTVLVVVWFLVELDRRLRGAPRRLLARIRFPPDVRRWAPEAALLAVAATWVVAGTPSLRFSPVTHGDEPKYLLHCEALYQGVGFDISRVQSMAELPADFRPRVGRNFRLLVEAMPGELRNLAVDAAAFLADPSRRFNRAQRDGGFLTGKNGGRYMVHQPGLSFLMLPAYYLDRQLTVTQRSAYQWPDTLRAVNAFFLAVYLLWTVLVFRFLRRLTGETATAWIATLALMLTLPVAAFPFQLYPELVAGVLVFLVAGHVLFPPVAAGRSRVARAGFLSSFFHGVLAGYLPWLHVRFGAMALVLAVGAGVALRRDRRRAFGFQIGFAVALGCLALYVYRITGSVLPTALWYAEGGDEVLTLTGAVRNSVAYVLDRDWGLLANAPVYLLALPGYFWIARRRPDVAWLCGATLFALLLPAAGHTLYAAGTTPTRLIVAAVPLAAVPLAEMLARYGGRRPFQAVFGLLLVLSLDNALAYNLHHLKHVGLMVDHTFSGWKASLLFPNRSTHPWEISALNGWLQVAWVAALFVLLAGPRLIHGARRRGLALSPPRVYARLSGLRVSILVATVSFGILGTVASAATGDWRQQRYRVPMAVQAWDAAGLLDAAGHCTVCISSRRGLIGTASMMATLEGVEPAVARRREAVGEAARQPYSRWLAMPVLIRAWYVEANGRDPSDSDIGHYLYVWREEALPPEEVRRRIFAAARRPADAGAGAAVSESPAAP